MMPAPRVPASSSPSSSSIRAYTGKSASADRAPRTARPNAARRPSDSVAAASATAPHRHATGRRDHRPACSACQTAIDVAGARPVACRPAGRHPAARRSTRRRRDRAPPSCATVDRPQQPVRPPPPASAVGGRRPFDRRSKALTLSLTPPEQRPPTTVHVAAGVGRRATPRPHVPASSTPRRARSRRSSAAAPRTSAWVSSPWTGGTWRTMLVITEPWHLDPSSISTRPTGCGCGEADAAAS